MNIKEKINDVYTRLQNLDIRPTKTNMETLLQSLYDLREVYNEITTKEDAENAGTEGRPAVDSE